jgi:hypothetical protein
MIANTHDRRAFPRPPAVIVRYGENGGQVEELHHGHDGMSIREYFAAQALNGLLSAAAETPQAAIAATLAVEFADALVAELEAK